MNIIKYIYNINNVKKKITQQACIFCAHEMLVAPLPPELGAELKHDKAFALLIAMKNKNQTLFKSIISENVSVWIAQREGRTKNGVDQERK